MSSSKEFSGIVTVSCLYLIYYFLNASVCECSCFGFFVLYPDTVDLFFLFSGMRPSMYLCTLVLVAQVPL